jgi:hypothetical protein
MGQKQTCALQEAMSAKGQERISASAIAPVMAASVA